jgi:hypothetical protein
MNDLYHVAIGQGVSRESFAIAKDGAVVLDDDLTRINAERTEELRHRAIPRNLPLRAVHRQCDDLARVRSPNHRLKYSA